MIFKKSNLILQELFLSLSIFTFFVVLRLKLQTCWSFVGDSEKKEREGDSIIIKCSKILGKPNSQKELTSAVATTKVDLEKKCVASRKLLGVGLRACFGQGY